MLPLVFCGVPLRIKEVLGLTLLKAQTTLAMRVDKNGNAVTQDVKPSARIAMARDSFRNGAVRLFWRA